MAVHALTPALAPANPLFNRFDAAMRHYADAKSRQVNLPAAPTMAQELAAAEAVESALASLTAVPAPDVRTLGQKLHITLRAAGTPMPLIASIEADVRRLARSEARA